MQRDLDRTWKLVDASVDDGDYFHRAFVFPTLEKLLSLKGGEAVFDAGCGNGAFARRMEKGEPKSLAWILALHS